MRDPVIHSPGAHQTSRIQRRGHVVQASVQSARCALQESQAKIVYLGHHTISKPLGMSVSIQGWDRFPREFELKAGHMQE